MSDEQAHYVNVYIDFEPNLAKTPEGSKWLEQELKDRCVAEVPSMISRMAELDEIMTTDLGDYVDFFAEARQAFLQGLWRSVVALIGIAAESFRSDLYAQIRYVGSASGKEVPKENIFGREDALSEKRKLEILKLFGVITPASHDKLSKIKKLRDRYVHPSQEDRDIGGDARKIMKLFQKVLTERFDARYTIREGKIVLK